MQKWRGDAIGRIRVFGIAAGILGAAAKEPLSVIASCCNKGMGVVAKKDSPIASIKDLKGKQVAISAGLTQEVFILERLRMEGMTIKDIEPVRISLARCIGARARDIEAYVGAEPGPGVSISSGIGKLVEYPYSTPMGSLNMVFGVHPETVANKPGAGEGDFGDPPQGQRVRHGHSARDDRDGRGKAWQKPKHWRSRFPTSN